METWQAIDSLRVVRSFAARPLEGDHLRRILHAGRRTGSSKNRQDWAFIVVRDRAHLAELSKVGPYAGHLAGAAAAGAPGGAGGRGRGRPQAARGGRPRRALGQALGGAGAIDERAIFDAAVLDLLAAVEEVEIETRPAPAAPSPRGIIWVGVGGGG